MKRVVLVLLALCGVAQAQPITSNTGLTKVKHDGSMTGDGTSTSPLAVAGGGGFTTAGAGLTATGSTVNVIGATGGGLSVLADSVGLLTSCSTGQGLTWTGTAWACSTSALVLGNTTITAGTMLSGGGDLSTNRTISLADIATSTVIGRVAAGTGAPSALSTTQLTTLVNTFTSTLSGAVPASGGGTSNFMRADGTWAVPAGTGALTTTTITAGNGLTGGGDLSANRTIDVGAGTGIAVNANDVQLAINGGVTQTCGAGTAVTAVTGVGITTCSAFGSSSLTNSAGNNVIPKSNGTNLVASSVSDNGVTVSTSEAVSIGGLATLTGGFSAGASTMNGDLNLNTHNITGAGAITITGGANEEALNLNNTGTGGRNFEILSADTASALSPEKFVIYDTGIGSLLYSDASGNITITHSLGMNSQKITGLANGTASSDAAAFGQIGTAVNAAVSGTSGRVAVFNGTNTVTGYAGFTSDSGGNVSTTSLTAAGNITSSRSAGVSPGFVLSQTSQRTWELYETVSSDQFNIWNSGFGDVINIAGTGGVQLNSTLGVTGATTLDSTAHIVGALTEDSTATFNGNTTVNGPTTPLGGQGILSVAETNTGQTIADARVIDAYNTGSYATAGSAITAYSVVARAQATRLSGANALTNIGVYADARNAQTNIALETDAGDVTLNNTSGTTTIKGAATLNSTLGVTGLSTLTGGFTAGAASTVNGKLVVHNASGAESLTVGTAATKDWSLYLNGNDLRLFEWATTDAGSGVDNIEFLAGGGVKIDRGALNMNSHQINNVTDPTSAQDAVTKNYVDTKAGLRIGRQVLSAASGTYTPTTGTKRVWLRMCGGGGGGGGAKGASSAAGVGAGGGAGGYTEAWIDPAATITGGAFSTGTAGLAGASTPAGGGGGGNSSIVIQGTTYTAFGGGGGGTSGTGISLGVIKGGVGGGGSSPGDIFSYGQGIGQYGLVLSVTIGISGAGGSSIFGQGGNSVVTAVSGLNGQGNCSGGSGAFATSATGNAGGAGTAGLIVIDEYRLRMLFGLTTPSNDNAPRFRLPRFTRDARDDNDGFRAALAL